MKFLPRSKQFNIRMMVAAPTFLVATLVMAVEPNPKPFAAGEKAQVKGVIVTHEGGVLKLRGDDDAIETVALTNDTKIQMKHGVFGQKSAMQDASLVPGLHIEARGKGNDKGELVADRVIFDPNSMRASRQIDARVSPLESRTGTLEGRTSQVEGRAGTLENKTGQLEGRANQLETTEKQTQSQVGQVKTQADQAVKGVTDVNGRVSNLDNYQPKESATVLFKVNSARLTPDAKKDLDDLAQKALADKGYLVEVAGFADKTGNLAANQELSQRRANAVIQYLEENGNIPIHRILTPSGLGISHEVADNKTSAGRKLNRRVEVKVLINQGLVAASNNDGQTSPAPAANTGAGQTTTPPPQQ